MKTFSFLLLIFFPFANIIVGQNILETTIRSDAQNGLQSGIHLGDNTNIKAYLTPSSMFFKDEHSNFVLETGSYVGNGFASFLRMRDRFGECNIMLRANSVNSSFLAIGGYSFGEYTGSSFIHGNIQNSIRFDNSVNVWDIGFRSLQEGFRNELTFSHDNQLVATIYWDGSYGQLSDKRLKSNINDIEIDDIGQKLDQIKSYKYTYNINDEDSERSLGFKAQEIEAVFPDLVKLVEIDEESFLTMNYESLLPILVSYFKKLDNEINENHAVLSAQSEMINTLNSKLALKSN